MSKGIKNQRSILNKLKIEQLNAMQIEAQSAIHNNDDVVLLSPTGTGKTLAFLLPILSELDRNIEEVQAMVIVPSRELAIQIEQVIREMGTGYKVNAVYGGRPFSKDKIELNHRPAIIVGTPGRIGDHLRRDTFSPFDIKMLVLDEFDKSLEIGFEDDMSEIISTLTGLKKRILTSATHGVEIPKFVGLLKPEIIDYSGEGVTHLEVKSVISPSKDKLDTLVDILSQIGDQAGIVFCNFKDSIQRVSDHLSANNIDHGCFYGGMEQKDRERALIKFRNGTYQLIIATDLAARGIDIPEIKFIVHYHLPLRSEEFKHRNGRTARMHREGKAYVILWKNEPIPEFILGLEAEDVVTAAMPPRSEWVTLFVSGGRKDKISKGDLAGFFFRQCDLEKDELGIIELKSDCAFVAVPKSKAQEIIEKTNNKRIKKRKVRINLI